jgi:hypothetical protein
MAKTQTKIFNAPKTLNISKKPIIKLTTPKKPAPQPPPCKAATIETTSMSNPTILMIIVITPK